MVLPTTVGHDLPHRYLVETNPALTDLKQFMSSDYLLGNLNYNPDTSWKRLGDGLYEQRLVQQAIVARTGQRFIDGLTSDEAQFKYLMDNAIASKQALGLSVGVSLTAAQVAALTHDIVWMEDQVINGEHVLVPVLYLAHANNRLAPNGALIQGSDVTLIAGNDLNNAGTLRATNNLTATANNDLVNSGLIQSGDRLSLTSTLGDITNRAGGIISGRDVSLTASRGDILNERTVTTHTASYAGQSLREDYADSAARIEAGNNLSLIAGRDINNVGSVLSAGGNATLIAGRDVNLISAQTQTGRRSGANNTSSSITQLTGSLTAGRDLGIGAGRNLTAVATTLSAGRNASLAAQENLTLGVAANESHSYSKSKKTTRQEDHVDQQITTLTAGGNVSLVARQGDLTLVAPQQGCGGWRGLSLRGPGPQPTGGPGQRLLAVRHEEERQLRSEEDQARRSDRRAQPRERDQGRWQYHPAERRRPDLPGSQAPKRQGPDPRQRRRHHLRGGEGSAPGEPREEQ
ncbi:adhesin HecA-like repeat protein [Pseudomonas psychrotolerans]|nr:adhesin HecA-like repeat protein [Pseudomonas psychrotolerans]